MRAVLQHVLDGHEPYPAVVVDRRGDLVATNAAFAALVDGAAPELTAPGANAYRLALHPHGLAPRVRNLTQWARHVLDRLDDELARHPDPVLAALHAELCGYLPTAGTPDPGGGAPGFAVPLRLAGDRGELHLLTAVTTFATATDVTVAELKLEAFLPADATTADALVAVRAAARPDAARPDTRPDTGRLEAGATG